MVDDDGSGYAEAGDDWVNAEPDEQAEDNGKGKGKKGGFFECLLPFLVVPAVRQCSRLTAAVCLRAGAAVGDKRKAEAVPGERLRLQRMFQAAQAKPKPQAPVDDASADALLGDILGGLGDGSGSGFAPKCVQPSLLSWMGPHISYVDAELTKLCVAVLLANGTAAATFLPHAAHNPTRLSALCACCRASTGAGLLRSAAPSHRPGQPTAGRTAPAGRFSSTPKAVSFAAQSAAKAKAASRLSTGGGAVLRTPPAAVAPPGLAAQAEAAADQDMAQADEPADAPDMASDAAADEHDAAADEPAAAGSVPGAPPQQQQQVTPGGSEPAPGPRPGAAAAAVAGDGKTPYRTSAPVMAEAKTPATAGPASGWQVMYGDESTAPGEPGAAEGEVCP